MIRSKIKQKIEHYMEALARKEVFLQAVLVGLLSGGLVVLFKLSIDTTFNYVEKFSFELPFWARVLILPLITTLGGLIAGLLIFKIAPEASGSGIPYIKMALTRFGKILRIRSIFVKFFAGVAGLGAGLPMGREGPSVQLGAGAGSVIGSLFRLNSNDKDKIIAAGAGSAIGATFNAPIAGAIFVLEELIQRFSSALLFPVLTATVTAASLSRYFLGNHPSFSIPDLNPDMNGASIIVCILLGFASGILGVLFSKLIYLNNDMYAKIHIPNWAKPAFAGFFIGIIGLFVPDVLGTGNSAISLLLANELGLSLIAIIFIAKFILTPFCFGSGTAGGIFLPMLMLGAFLGFMMAIVANNMGYHVNSGVIALVGMAAFMSAVARTPITAVVIVFEMSAGYNYILPIMLSAAIADLTAGRLHHKPIYTELLIKQTHATKQNQHLSEISAQQIMHPDITTLQQNITLSQALKIIKCQKQEAFPVLNSDKKLGGIVTRTALNEALIQENQAGMPIERVMSFYPVTTSPDTDLHAVYVRMQLQNTEFAVVISPQNDILGLISLADLHDIADDRLNTKSCPAGNNK